MEGRQFKYQLARRGKHVCPNCGHRTFVLYVDENNQPLADTVGKCDRLNNCAYHYTPSQYFKDNGVDYQPTIKKVFKHTPPPLYIGKELLEQSCNATLTHHNKLVEYLRRTFGDELTWRMVTSYFVGTSKQFGGGATVFYQIDRNGLIHRGKVMQYNADGHRAKYTSGNNKGGGMVTSVHSLMKMNDRLPPQCLFGEHLLSLYPDRPVALFESEKTAMVAGATILTDFICMAVGSCQNLTPEMLKPLKGRTVLLFPDQGKYLEWHCRGERIRTMVGGLFIADIMEYEASNSGDDLMDWIVERYPELPKDIDYGVDAVAPFNELPIYRKDA